MADTKISVLPAATTLGNTDIFVLNQSSTTKTIAASIVSQKIQADYTAATTLTGSVAATTYPVGANDQTVIPVTVTGAALGDFALGSSSVSIGVLQITASVTAANTVTVLLKNTTGNIITLPSAVIKAKVWKQ